MQLAEIKELIEKYDFSAFKELIESEGDYKDGVKEFEEETGLKFEFVDASRQGEYYNWTWKLNGQLYQISGEYSSYDGCYMDKIQDFYEAKAVQITVYREKD